MDLDYLELQKYNDFRYYRTPSLFVLHLRTLKRQEDFNLQGLRDPLFIYLGNANDYLATDEQVSFSSFLSFCARHSIHFGDAIPGLVQKGSKELAGVVAPPGRPTHVSAREFVWSYGIAVVAQYVKDVLIPRWRDRQKTPAQEDILNRIFASLTGVLEQQVLTELAGRGALPLLANDEYEQVADILDFLLNTNFASPQQVPLANENDYANFLGDDKYVDRTIQGLVQFDRKSLARWMVESKFNRKVMLSSSSMDPWTECVALLEQAELPQPDPEELRPAPRGEIFPPHYALPIGHFAELSYVDLARLFPPAQFKRVTDLGFLRDPDAPTTVVVGAEILPEGRSVWPCVLLDENTTQVSLQNVFLIKVSKADLDKYSDGKDVKLYFFNRFLDLGLDQTKSVSIRRFLYQNATTAPAQARLNNLGKQWPTALLQVGDLVRLFELYRDRQDGFKFLVVKPGQGQEFKPIVEPIFLYYSTTSLPLGAPVTLALYQGFQRPLTWDSNQVVFCFKDLADLNDLFQALAFLAMEQDVYLSGVPFLEEIFTVCGLEIYYPETEALLIRSDVFPRLKRRIQILATSGVIDPPKEELEGSSKRARTTLPLEVKAATDVSLFNTEKGQKEEKETTKVLSDEMLRLQKMIDETQDSIFKLSKEGTEKGSDLLAPSALSRRLAELTAKKATAESTLQSLRVLSGTESNSPKSLNQTQNFYSSVAAKETESFQSSLGTTAPNIAEIVDNKIAESDKNDLTSGLFEQILQLDQTNIVAGAPPPPPQRTFREQLLDQKGPKNRFYEFVEVVCTWVPGYPIERMYDRVPPKPESFESQMYSVSSTIKGVIEEADDFLRESTLNRYTVEKVIQQPQHRQLRNLVAKYCGLTIVSTFNTQPQSGKPRFVYYNIYTKIAEVREHIKAICNNGAGWANNY